jgi:pilus assembly protein CpaF
MVRREYLDVGPLGEWLEDPSVTTILCHRPDRIELVGAGRTTEPNVSPLGFSGERAMLRAMRRLIKRAGGLWGREERVVERRLAGGARLIALLPPVVDVMSMTLRKPAPAGHSHTTAGDGLPGASSAFLARTMETRANVLLCGEPEGAVLTVCAALLGATPPSRGIVVAHAGCGVRLEDRRTVTLELPPGTAATTNAVRVAIELGADYTLVTSPKTSAAAAAIGAMATAGKTRGVLVTTGAPTLDRALAKLTSALMLARVGLELSAAAALVASNVDVAIEVAADSDGRPRITRIAEIAPSGLSFTELTELPGLSGPPVATS